MSRPFVSCEDDMADIFGIYNAFCAVTSLPILATPLIQLNYSFQKRLPFPLLVLLVSLSILYVGNLQQHTMIHNKLFIRTSTWYFSDILLHDFLRYAASPYADEKCHKMFRFSARLPFNGMLGLLGHLPV